MTGPQQTPATSFTPDQHRALRELRIRYEQDCDQFSRRERAHLHFLRWMYNLGRLESTPGNTELRGGE
ncbi:MAG: hypothetical protein ACR2JC_17070 [Chloroflexota bacterium]|nr:MAG: hypothetical protein DLM70_16245 [Chloroflexota bacterium]